MGRGSVNDSLLKESLYELYEQAPCGYIFMFPDWSFARANQTFLDWTGYTREELVPAMRFQELLTIPGRIFFENQYAPLLRMQGSVKEVTFDLVRKDRDPLPVFMNSVLRLNEEGQPAIIASTVFDATDRRAYERELLQARAKAEQLAAIVTVSSDAIFQVSPANTIQTWNAGAERLFGYSQETALGLPLAQLLPAFADDTGAGSIHGQLRAGLPVHLDTVARHATGEHRDVSAALTPHIGLLGAPTAVSLIVRDESERKQGERLQQEFLAMASHELRHPVSIIKGYAQLMRRKGQYNEAGVETIVGQSDHLARLIDDLLLASQIAAGRLELQLEAVDLAAEAHAAAEHKRIERTEIRIETGPDPVPAQADPRRLRQVLANLLSNAIKYSPDGSEILVRTGHADGQPYIAVVDQGAGIPADALPHLFDRFFRVSGTARTAQGLGLGLFITRQIINAHGGSITVESELGRGSAFTVTLPPPLGAPAQPYS